MASLLIHVSRTDGLLDAMANQLEARNLSWIRSDPGTQTVNAIGRHMPDLVIVDTGTDSDARVLEDVDRIKRRYPGIPVFLVAQHSSEALAIGALKAGVDDYFKAPFNIDDLLAGLDHRLPARTCRSKSGQIQAKIEAKMVGHSRVMTELKKHLERVSKVDSTVLITGETGTGKELAAGLIHENGNRAKQSMINVNCAAIPDSLVESELFGYERGAFTGAVATTPGRFKQAHGGTLFLDEIGDMTPFAQAKILRVIESKEVYPIGGISSIPLDFRLIVASNRDPEALMAKGAFRDDLFYRLNVARLHLPPLREHREDIPALIDHGIKKLNSRFDRHVRGLKADVVKLLLRYEWPGNVRELMNILEGAFINMPDKRIETADLPIFFKKKLSESQHLPSDERQRIISALLETNWNKSNAAAKLKWSRMTLYRKMSKYRIIEYRKPERQSSC